MEGLCWQKNDGKNDVRSFETKEEAEAFYERWNAHYISGNNIGLSQLSGVVLSEVFAAMAKLQANNATLPEAVGFFDCRRIIHAPLASYRLNTLRFVSRFGRFFRLIHAQERVWGFC